MLKAKNGVSDRWSDVWIAIFALGAIMSIAARLAATSWTNELYIVVYLALIAALTGLALGYSRFSPWLTAVFSLLYGTFFITWLLGTTVEIEIPWRERIINHLGWRFSLAIEQFVTGQTVTDSILFTTIMAALLWIIISSVTFTLIRKGSAWLAIIPLGLTLIVIVHYDQDLARNTRALFVFLFFALLIVGRVTFLQYRQKWQQEGIQTTEITHANFLRILLIVVTATLIITWAMPTEPISSLRNAEVFTALQDQWDSFTDQISDIFTVDHATSTTPISLFAESLDLGQNAALGEEIVFVVTLDSKPPAGYRHYWRVRSYDHYENAQWSNSLEITEKDLLPEDFNLAYPEWKGSQTAAYTFTSYTSYVDRLYFPGRPTWVSRPVEALVYPLPDSGEDLITLNSKPELYAGETYHVISQISTPSAEALRETPMEYPGWLDAFRQIPEGLSPEIAALAERIARGHDNPYDIAFTINRYLRSNYTYAESIPTPPSNVDPIEWFLFDAKIGFCNYYATAHVLLMRSLGIPARISVGYAQGDQDLSAGTYTVRRLDRHAWPEVYFVDYGWVSFEPTESQRDVFFYPHEQTINDAEPSIEPNDYQMRDLPDIELEETWDGTVGTDPGDVTNLPRQSTTQSARKPMNKYLIALFAIIAGGIVFIVLRYPAFFKINLKPLPVLIEQALDKHHRPVPNWLRRWSYRARMSAAENAYRQLGQSIKIMGQPLDPAQTPAERAQTLTKLIPQAYQPALEIVSDYQLAIYSNQIVNEAHPSDAGWQVLRLAFKTRLRRLFDLRLSP